VARYCAGNLAANQDPGGESNRQRRSRRSISVGVQRQLIMLDIAGGAVSHGQVIREVFMDGVRLSSSPLPIRAMA
jgi:hypothetical protein